MNLGLSALVGVALFILPGFLVLSGQAIKKGLPPTFSLNREVFIAILISLLSHVLLLATMWLLPHIPKIDAVELYGALAGGSGYSPGETFVHSVPYFVAYVMVSYVMCLSVGYLLGFAGVEIINQHAGVSRNLVAGTNQVWSIVDVLTRSDTLYRGLYHSVLPRDGYCPEPTLNLVLASRWCKGMPPPGGSENGEPIYKGFRDILAYIDSVELKSMIRGSDDPSEDKEFETKLDELVESPSELDALFRDLLNAPPDLHLMWHDIRNLNVRYIDLSSLGGAEKPTKDVSPEPTSGLAGL